MLINSSNLNNHYVKRHYTNVLLCLFDQKPIINITVCRVHKTNKKFQLKLKSTIKLKYACMNNEIIEQNLKINHIHEHN